MRILKQNIQRIEKHKKYKNYIPIYLFPIYKCFYIKFLFNLTISNTYIFIYKSYIPMLWPPKHTWRRSWAATWHLKDSKGGSTSSFRCRSPWTLRLPATSSPSGDRGWLCSSNQSSLISIFAALDTFNGRSASLKLAARSFAIPAWATKSAIPIYDHPPRLIICSIKNYI